MKPHVKTIAVFLLVFCLAASKNSLERMPRFKSLLQGPDLEPTQVAYRADSLKKLSFGFENFIASLLWIQLLQEAKHTPLKENTLSWEFAQTNAINRLDPNFDVAYHYGSLMVSFFRRDKEGGKLLLENWVKFRPTLWRAHHMLGMHYFLELNDSANAAPHIIKASQLPGAPAFISSLGVRLLSQSGATISALQSAIELFTASQNIEARARLAFRIRALRWHLQKESLQNALAAYRKTHLSNPKKIEDLVPHLNTSLQRDISSFGSDSSKDQVLQQLLKESFSFKLSPERNSVEALDPAQEKEFKHLGAYLNKEE